MHDSECDARQKFDHFDGQTYCANCGGREDDVLGATVMVNRDPVGHVEVVRVKTRVGGEHLYRYKLYEAGSVVTYGVLTHDEKNGPYVLMHEALGRILADTLVDD